MTTRGTGVGEGDTGVGGTTTRTGLGGTGDGVGAGTGVGGSGVSVGCGTSVGARDVSGWNNAVRRHDDRLRRRGRLGGGRTGRCRRWIGGHQAFAAQRRKAIEARARASNTAAIATSKPTMPLLAPPRVLGRVRRRACCGAAVTC